MAGRHFGLYYGSIMPQHQCRREQLLGMAICMGHAVIADRSSKHEWHYSHYERRLVRYFTLVIITSLFVMRYRY